MGASPDPTAVKPTNKAGQPAAEPVEPRARAKGSADQYSTHRAQYRDCASQVAGTRTANRKRVCRQIPEVGAVCLNWARTVLGGGRVAMRVPTANPFPPLAV